MLPEKPVAKVLPVDLVREIFRAVDEFRRFRRKDPAVRLDVGILERIDVHRHPDRVPGQVGRAGHHPVIEAGAVVIRHRQLIIGVILINKIALFNWITCIKKLLENVQQPVSNMMVANHFPAKGFPLEVFMEKMDVPQFRLRQNTTFGIGFAFYLK